MAGRKKIKSLTVGSDSLLQIPLLVKLPKPSDDGGGEVTETSGATWGAGGTKIESLKLAFNGLFMILHLPQPIKTSENRGCEDIWIGGTIWMTR